MVKDNDLNGFTQYLERRVSPGTTKVYLYHVSRWLVFIDGIEPTPDIAQRYINLLANSPNTVNLAARSIEKWFRWKGIDITFECPTIPEPSPQYLDLPVVYKLINACRNPLERALIVVLFDTAVRIKELLGLELDNIHWDRGLISVTRKGGKEKLVNISPKGLVVLKEWIGKRKVKSSKVFGDLVYYSAWRIIKKVGKRVGLNVHPHMLRHSRAVQMRMNGATIEDIKDHLGHRNIATTANIYASLKAIDLKERIPQW